MNSKAFPVIDMVATGKNIVFLRQARGLSVSAVQEYFGFDAPQAIYKWQKGQTLPSVDNLFALAALFEVSIDDILIPERNFQVLPQDTSCGSGRFGAEFTPCRITPFHCVSVRKSFDIESGLIIPTYKFLHRGVS